MTVNYNGNFRMQSVGLTPHAANMREYGQLWLEANEEMPEEGRNYWGFGTAEKIQLLADGYEGPLTDIYFAWDGMYVKDVDSHRRVLATHTHSNTTSVYLAEMRPPDTVYQDFCR